MSLGAPRAAKNFAACVWVCGAAVVGRPGARGEVPTEISRTPIWLPLVLWRTDPPPRGNLAGSAGEVM